jgi:protein-S-isoprenylcysteine O-methyltransferase Ste14
MPSTEEQEERQMERQTTVEAGERTAPRRTLDLRRLVGSGKRIGLLTLPFLAAGLALNVLRPSLFSVGGPPILLKVISGVILIPGITIWIWSVALILTRVPKGELITGGPYSLVKHPLYTGVALLVLPWIGFLLNTWLGVLIGIVLYVGSRIFAPEEERALARHFGAVWDEYLGTVKVPWL